MAFLFMTFYYYCLLVVMPLRLEWKRARKKMKERNPINVNVASKFQHRGEFNTQKHKRQFEEKSSDIFSGALH